MAYRGRDNHEILLNDSNDYIVKWLSNNQPFQCTILV